MLNSSYLQLTEIALLTSIISSFHINGNSNYLIYVVAYYAVVVHLHKDAIFSYFPDRCSRLKEAFLKISQRDGIPSMLRK